MNIQIFGKQKCFETKKAERYFKERRIKYQFIDLPRFGMSPGELRNIVSAVGGLDKVVDTTSKDYEGSFYAYLASDEAKKEKLLDTPTIFKTPIVRNGKLATVGYCPEVWKSWE